MVENHRSLGLAAVAAALTLLLALVWLISAGPASAAPGIQCVNRTGTGCDPICGGNCHNAIQKAIDQAAIGDEIRVAGGRYTMPAGTVARIEKELQIMGGYNPACSRFDPDRYVTVLDGQGLGSTVEIVAAGDVSLMHLSIFGGNGTGNCAPDGCGGGIYVENSTLHLGHCFLSDNLASDGIDQGWGGGLYALDSDVEIWETHVVSNTAQANPGLAGNGYGGGIYIYGGTASLRQNLIADNMAHASHSGYGGGIYLSHLDHADLLSNVIEANRGNPASSFYGSYGGGLYIDATWFITVAGNRFQGNHAQGQGGGIFVDWSRPDLSRNWILSNGADTGGGIMIKGSVPITVSNNLIAQNSATGNGGGVCALGVSSPGPEVLLVNNTLAENEQAGVAAWQYATLILNNNLLSGNDLGITETDPASSNIIADTNLFWNDNDPMVGSNPILEDPVFGPDYHPLAGSPALDAGLPVPWLTVDLDGAPRPQNAIWDIGAYEGPWMWRVMLPLVQNGYSPLVLIFDDDFDDGTLTGWTPNLGTWTNPGVHMRGEYATGNAWNMRSSTGGDFVYQGTVNLLSGNAVGLAFRSSADGTSSYDVILDAVDGVFKISKRPPYTVLDSYSMAVQRNHPYQVKVMANGDTIDAYLDGVKRLTVTDTAYTTGHLGVMLFRATATYDDLQAWALP